MSALVSILMPAYNAQRWIKAAIESALNQTWPNKEIIIVDDGSTDRTLEIARKFESKSVKVVTQENRGASAARNRAYSLSQGDFIQWLDADDQLAPDKLARQLVRVKSIPGQDVLFSSAWGKFFYRPDNARFQPGPLWQNMMPVEWMIKSFEGSGWMQTSCWLVSRTLTESAGSWDERLSLNDDGEYFARVVTKSQRVEFVAESRVYYRTYVPGSLSSFRRISEEALRSFHLAGTLTVEHLISMENSERTRAAAIARLRHAEPFFVSIFLFAGSRNDDEG